MKFTKTTVEALHDAAHKLGFEPPAQRHSVTSVAAAQEIKPTATTLRARVYEFLKAQGERGATDEEMQLGLPMAASTQRPRRVELVKAGLIGDSRLTRKTSSGRSATVWKVL